MKKVENLTHDQEKNQLTKRDQEMRDSGINKQVQLQ